MGYAIAAYAIVIGTLGWYGWRVQRQRRELQGRGGSEFSTESES